MRAIICLATGLAAVLAVQGCQEYADPPGGGSGGSPMGYDAGSGGAPAPYDAGWGEDVSDDVPPAFTLDAANPPLTFHISKARTMASPVIGANGIAWDGTAFWLAVGSGKLSKFDPASMTVVTQLQTEGTTAEYAANTALAWDGQKLWMASSGTSSNGIMSAVDPATGAVLTSRGMPYTIGVGLTWDGTQLWMANGIQTVYRMAVADGGITASFPVGSWRGTGIAYHDGELWISDLFDGITVYSTDGTPVARVVVANGLTPQGGNMGQLCFVGDQLVTLNDLGLTYWDISR